MLNTKPVEKTKFLSAFFIIFQTLKVEPMKKFFVESLTEERTVPLSQVDKWGLQPNGSRNVCLSLFKAEVLLAPGVILNG